MCVQGSTFYESLLEKLQKVYRFELGAFLHTDRLPPDTPARATRLALLTTQRALICLGDIARYKEQSTDTGKVNYAKARK